MSIHDPESCTRTEDQGRAGFYRFVPEEPGNLSAGGALEMLALADTPSVDTRKGQRTGSWRAVKWVAIDDPDPQPIQPDSVHSQGVAKGGATFGRLEGTWFGNDRAYFVSTNGGDAEAGQVWGIRPGRRAACTTVSNRRAETCWTCRTTSA